MGEASAFRVSSVAQEIVDGVRDILSASVVLYDAETRTHHLAMNGDRWYSHESTTSAEPRDLCYMHARINDRWTLYVCSRRSLHPDAQSIAVWAAEKLAPHLPTRTADEPTYPPAADSGGSGGSAETGIPVWWAHKVRN
jgi:hypothetical protein